jgi:hypothetical protein
MCSCSEVPNWYYVSSARTVSAKMRSRCKERRRLLCHILVCIIAQDQHLILAFLLFFAHSVLSYLWPDASECRIPPAMPAPIRTPYCVITTIFFLLPSKADYLPPSGTYNGKPLFFFKENAVISRPRVLRPLIRSLVSINPGHFPSDGLM